jgi:adenine-specific DNA-methyltransferase
MQNLLDDLKTLLQNHERLVVDGELLKNKVIELALQLDPILIKALLSRQSTKKHFFQEVDGVFVFDKIKFQRFISNKAFLPDSYTAFKNKIGLVNDEGDYFSESKEVVLAWPYRDCVLEGGQTKDDEERDESFWNETLAPDEIDRLYLPKVLNNFQKYDKQGKHKVTDISLSDSFIIRGNNLLALYSLKKVYTGKVKMIYIDPPYNKKNDVFYNDSFKNSTWLTFMKNRLEVAQTLLSPTGLFFIQIDDFQQAYLKVLCDEIFGRGSFVTTICVKMSEATGVKMAHAEKRIPKLKEYIHLYKKKPESVISLKPIKIEKNEWDDEYKLFIEGVTREEIERLKEIISNDERTKKEEVEADKICSKFRLTPLNKELEKNNIEKEKELDWKYNNAWRIIRTVATTDGAKRLADEKKKQIKKGFTIVTPNKKMYVITPDYDEEKEQPRIKLLFADDYLTINLGDFWQDIKTTGLENEGGVKLTKGKKPEELLKRIVEMSTEKGDLVLDFVLGTGTTAAVAHKMNRKFIGIEQLDYGKNDSINRLKNVIKGDTSGISGAVNWQGGGSFIYCELAKANQDFIDKIKAAKTARELKAIWKSMQEKAFISYKVDIKSFDENTESFEELTLDDQKKFLIEVLDKNLLYVNYSEIEDKDYNISKEDKNLNAKFYSLK